MAVCQWGVAARAGDWTLNTGLNVSEQFTDNVNLVPESAGRKADVITDVGPFITVRGAGARASLDLDYTFRQLYFAERGDDERIHNLTSRGQLEFLRQIGFIDATASMSREVVNNLGAFSSSAAGQTVNRADERAVSVSPFFLNHFGQWLDSEMRLRYGMVSVDSAAIPDTHEYSADINLISGREFARLRWTLRGHADRLDRDPVGGLDTDASSIQADYDATYALVRGVGLIGGVGYEQIDDPTLAEQPEGVTWRGGLRLDPSSRTTLTATYGRRYADTNIFVEGSHQLSSRTGLTASYTESLQTSQQLVGRSLTFLGVDADGNLIDTRTGLPFAAGNDAFGLQAATFRQRAGFLGVSTRRQRDTFTLNATYESRTTETPTVRQDIVRGAHMTAGRRLSRRTTANLGADFRNIDFGDGSGREDNELTLSANLTYQIFRGTSAVIAFIRTQRKSNVDGGDLTENAASIRVSQGF